MSAKMLFLGVACLLVGANVSFAEEPENKYLTPEGKLAQPLTVVLAQGGFAGFTGTKWGIEVDGAWTQSDIHGAQHTPRANGKLSAEELKAVAERLAELDLLGLPRQAGEYRGANPSVVEIRFGDRSAELTLPPGGNPAVPGDDGEPSEEQRFGGILQTVKALLVAPEK